MSSLATQELWSQLRTSWILSQKEKEKSGRKKRREERILLEGKQRMSAGKHIVQVQEQERNGIKLPEAFEVTFSQKWEEWHIPISFGNI